MPVGYMQIGLQVAEALPGLLGESLIAQVNIRVSHAAQVECIWVSWPLGLVVYFKEADTGIAHVQFFRNAHMQKGCGFIDGAPSARKLFVLTFSITISPAISVAVRSINSISGLSLFVLMVKLPKWPCDSTIPAGL